MALSEIQKEWLTKAVLYQHVRQINTDVDSIFNRLRTQLEFLNLIAAADLTALSVDAGAQTQLGTMRTSLNNLISNYDSNYAAIADQLRTIG